MHATQVVTAYAVLVSQLNDLSSQLLSISDRQLTMSKHVTEAMSQQSEGTGLFKQLVQGTPCIHGKCIVCHMMMACHCCFQ